MMAGRDLLGQTGDRRVEHADEVTDVVGPGVTRPQAHGQRLAGGISEAVDGMEPEPAL